MKEALSLQTSGIIPVANFATQPVGKINKSLYQVAKENKEEEGKLGREDWQDLLHQIPGADQELVQVRAGLSKDGPDRDQYTKRLMGLVMKAFQTERVTEKTNFKSVSESTA